MRSRATPADFIAWARAAARNGLATATIYARTAGELHRDQGVGRDWQPFGLPGEDRLAAAWRAGYDEPAKPGARRPATTHAARTAAFIEAADDN